MHVVILNTIFLLWFSHGVSIASADARYCYNAYVLRSLRESVTRWLCQNDSR